MMSTHEATGTGTDIAAVPAAGDNEAGPWHNVCRICHPRESPVRPLVAICGEPLLGIRAARDAPRCELCDYLTPLHERGHRA
ncbi:hypothetical protein A6A06_26720 [Streptomyces sp. CB02923]|nr:hypothetical protein A6A06_26720 [Streptomyces sp. CB02923]